MKEFLLVLLGALISCGTTMINDWFRFKKDENIYYIRKKEEIYIKTYDFIYRINLFNKNLITSEEANINIDLIMNLQTNLSVYASNDIKNLFNKIVEKYKSKEDFKKEIIELETLIKQELNIKNGKK